MKIAFFETTPEELVFFKKSLKGHLLKFYPFPLNSTNAKKASDCEIISVFLFSKLTPKVIKKLPSLKLIVTRSTGYDHINLEFCKKNGIKVCNAPSYAENTVAEHALALLLSFARQLPEINSSRKKSNFSILNSECFDLKGKTLGVIGTGRIGSNIIRIASCFQMKIIACDILKNKALQKAVQFQYVSLDFLLRNSDVISLHVPLTKSTYHLINKESFQKMKKGVILINTSRGEIVDNSALLFALKSNKLAGAGLDVIEGEEILKNERVTAQLKSILNDKKVIFTPHVAFYSKESLSRLLNEVSASIKDFARNKPLSSVI